MEAESTTDVYKLCFREGFEAQNGSADKNTDASQNIQLTYEIPFFLNLLIFD